MDEVKHLPGVLGQSKREVMKYFKDYIEDYNTGKIYVYDVYVYDVWCMH